MALSLSSAQSSGKDDNLCHEDSLIFSLFKHHSENNPTVVVLFFFFHNTQSISQSDGVLLYEAFCSSTYWKKGDAMVINVGDIICEDKGKIYQK